MDPLIIAMLLFVAAAAALIAEVFVVSFGLLSLISLGLGIASVVVAFQVSTVTGVGFVIAAPITAGIILRWGLKIVQRSNTFVPKAVISDDAGMHHAAQRLGIVIGQIGTLSTAARPTARARFPGGEIDVQCDSSAEAGQSVKVERIEGPTIFVSLIPT